ncbi:hypothetical protein GALMADRAFT_211804 [Galerina marginata CBS 339.88]|uniref:Uncharacterized protein n=1 Tax=Galerina marginata (strain CBS 339.88) TaxID=685588 RepID=A0A067T7F9_GALM3|nr:hypothetical protein GALMADRAFT_211804 [Galerina marginata CBS 339.88]
MAIHPDRLAAHWTRLSSFSIPGVRTRLCILVPNAGSFNHLRVARMRHWKRSSLLVRLGCLFVFFTVVLVTKSFARSDWGEQWSSSWTTEPHTFVFKQNDLPRIWKEGYITGNQGIAIVFLDEDILTTPQASARDLRADRAGYVQPPHHTHLHELGVYKFK